MKLQEFNLKIEYLPGKLNSVADYLSRQPSLSPKCQSCLARIPNFDPELCSVEIISAIKEDEGELSLVDLSDEVKAQEHFISTFHNRAHHGVNGTLKRLQRYYTWPQMKETVSNYVKSCDICQRSKDRNSKPYGLMQPLPIPERRFSCIGIDWFFLPKSPKGLDCVMIVIDYSSKYVKLIPCTSKDSSAQMANLFKSNWHDLGFGLPSVIISDRDSKITSKFWTNLCESLNIQRNLATARHQQTNGQVERTIRTVKTMMMMILDEHHLQETQWRQILSS